MPLKCLLAALLRRVADRLAPPPCSVLELEPDMMIVQVRSPIHVVDWSGQTDEVLVPGEMLQINLAAAGASFMPSRVLH